MECVHFAAVEFQVRCDHLVSSFKYTTDFTNCRDLNPEKDSTLNMHRQQGDSVCFDEVVQLCETVRLERRKFRIANQLQSETEYAPHDVYAFEASLLNCFGLQELHRVSEL